MDSLGQLDLGFAQADRAKPAAAAVTRPVHYLGSKLRVVDGIRAVVDAVDPTRGAICDLFAGSGTVSLAFAGERDVVAVDIQEYARVLCSALLDPPADPGATALEILAGAGRSETAGRLARAAEPLLEHEAECAARARNGHPDDLYDVVEHGSLLAWMDGTSPAAGRGLRAALEETASRLRRASLAQSPDSIVTRYFGGVYFSFQQAVHLDWIRESIAANGGEAEDFFLAALLSTASDAVNTIGKQFAQPLRPRRRDGQVKANLLTKILQDRAADVTAIFEDWLRRYATLRPWGRAHRVIREDYRETLANDPGPVSVVYADPPYTRDHYSRFYHVLETLCLRDNPPVSTTRIGGADRLSRGMYRAERHQSPFCIKSQAPGAFEALFAGVARWEVPLVLSYSPFTASGRSHPRMMTIDGLAGLARRYFRGVERVSLGRLAHSKLNATHLHLDSSDEAEVLLLCTP